ncbi:uncharacterized protein LOC110063164 [Orbicella faveolata]|uniref:uncharacterized protein LOC110063164 n=1 Tax=Orbicella faveolata TaxID=48498 RepID=UPI0009E5C0EC|nr:uncharacterized protein LOC110063164 [Orbicella faveolata]
MAANNFCSAKPLYSPYGGSKESLVIVDETEAVCAGSINGNCRERSSSLNSIVSVHHDREAAAIEGNKPVTKDDVIRNLSLSSPSLKGLRWFLLITFLWFPQNASSARKTFYTAMQVLIVAFLCGCYAFDMGAFHNRSLIQDELGETVTAAKNIIWSFRYLEMYIVGILYFRKRHLEKMLSEVILTRRYWKKVRRTILKVSIAVFLFVFVVPVTSKIVQMNLTTRKVESFSLKEILCSVSLSIMARIVALPIFLAFIYVVYVTFSQIRLFKEQLQKWPEGMKEEARNRFIDIKTTIRDAERSFQTFLIAHLLLLLVLLIPAIFSCVERLQSESHYEETDTDQMEMRSALKPPGNTENFIAAVNGTYYQRQQVTFLLKLPANYGQNTTHNAPHKRTVSKTDAAGIAKIVCANLGSFVEMLVLYSLPLFFLAKLHKIMASLPEVVQDLKFSEQTKYGYLFQNKQIQDEVKGDLSTGRGIQILRMNLTGIKAALLTLLMPFLTTAIHLLFLHVDLD